MHRRMLRQEVKRLTFLPSTPDGRRQPEIGEDIVFIGDGQPEV
jgi:hypothetical protein